MKSLAFTGKALVYELLGGDSGRPKRLAVGFSKVEVISNGIYEVSA